MKSSYIALLCAVMIIAAPGCAMPREATIPDKRPLGVDYPTTYEYPDAEQEVDPDGPADVLTLQDALTRAMLGNRELESSAFEIRAREAHTLQAALWPNPEVEAEIEEFAGTGPLTGFGSSEQGVSLSQSIPLGGDVGARRRVAAGERDLAAWDYEAARLDLYVSTTHAFAAVLAAQERLLLADSLLSLSARFAQTVADRADAGKVSPLEATRAGVVRSNAVIAQNAAARELTAARKRLSSLWGDQEPDFQRASGDFTRISPVPPLDSLLHLIERNPDVARYSTERELSQADLRLEKARRIPDLVLKGGGVRFMESGETAFRAGISIPLPLFDRNQGAIREARFRIRKTESEAVAARVHVQRRLASAYETLASAYEAATTLSQEIVPAARETFDATEEGYREGKFDLLLVLDSQRTFFEATNQYLDAAQTYHEARVEVERVIGTSLGDL